MVFSGTTYSKVTGKPTIECTFTIDPTKNPKWIDVTRTSDKVTWPGIYELKGDTLTVCLGTPAGNRPIEFKTKEGTQQVSHKPERLKLPLRLEFLAPVPEFHEFRFGQDEATIREIATRRGLTMQGSAQRGGFTVSRKDDETLALSMRDGKCSGIKHKGKMQREQETFTAWGKEVALAEKKLTANVLPSKWLKPRN